MPTTIQSKMEYFKGLIRVTGTLYADGTSALVFTDDNTGEPVAKASVNMSAMQVHDAALPDDHVFIKNYSENEGVIQTLLDGKIVELTGQTMVNRFVTVQAVKIINENVLNQIKEAKERVV